jgi:membrane protein implicated in regulation of membrane protease activity
MLVVAYVALAVLGGGYVLVSMFMGHGADGGHAGGEHTAADTYGLDHSGHGTASAGDGAAASFHFPFFSPLALATLGASVGGLGLVAHYGLGLVDGASLFVAVPGALVLTYVVTYGAWRLVGGSRGTSTIRAEDLVGVPAEIITPIPEGGVGEAAASVGGQRFTGPAREVDGRAVGRSTVVTVVRLSGSTLIVKLAAEPNSLRRSGGGSGGCGAAPPSLMKIASEKA